MDFEGRTALHYAAVIPDNGHYYNLLQQLGANAKDLDDVKLFRNQYNFMIINFIFIYLISFSQNGRSADEYLQNPDLMPFHQLLGDYGISEEAAQDMLSDKGTSF